MIPAFPTPLSLCVIFSRLWFDPHQLCFGISQWPFNINIETSMQFYRLRFYPVFVFIKSALLSILSNFSIHSFLQDIFYSILTGTSFSSLPQQKYPAIVQITHTDLKVLGLTIKYRYIKLPILKFY